MDAKRDALPSLLPPFAVALFEIFWLTELRRLKQANETVEKRSQSHSLLLLLACHSNLKRRQKERRRRRRRRRMLSAGYQTRYPIVAVYTVVVVVVPFLFCFVDFSFSHSFLFVSYVFSLLMDYRDSSSLLLVSDVRPTLHLRSWFYNYY